LGEALNGELNGELSGEMDGGEISRRPELLLVEKHSRAIRWMHWINFPVLTIMIWSGLLIYWGDSVPPYQHAHQVYRVGIGGWTLVRLFPDWFWKLLNAPYQLTTGMGYHFLFMWVFAINGIVYAAYLAVSGEWRVLWPKRRSFVDAIRVTLYDLHWPAARRRGLPAQGKYNGAQRIAYSAIVLMGAGSLLTGLAIYKPTQAHWLTGAMGGYEMARWLHFWLTMGFCAFFLVHVWQVVMAGWNNFRSMVSGAEVRGIGEKGIGEKYEVERVERVEVSE
jgi:thiosulfate reductase cytochrome b subunit